MGQIELNKPKVENVEHTAFDGFGLASPEFCDMISEKYGYKIDYFGLRMYPTATKDLCVRFPFIKYFKANFKEREQYLFNYVHYIVINVTIRI